MDNGGMFRDGGVPQQPARLAEEAPKVICKIFCRGEGRGIGQKLRKKPGGAGFMFVLLSSSAAGRRRAGGRSVHGSYGMKHLKARRGSE